MAFRELLEKNRWLLILLRFHIFITYYFIYSYLFWAESVLATFYRNMCWDRHLKATCPVAEQFPLESVPNNSSMLSMVIPTDCPNDVPRCDPSSIYRSINGSCNNLMHPRWGQANLQELRLLPNAYNDGIFFVVLLTVISFNFIAFSHYLKLVHFHFSGMNMLQVRINTYFRMAEC